ncbi:hypothetical protein BSKO_07770 [Bryopsis sp. KO-2023]|nr:hypothetical protein BSKO_07770 [Bryopsis sp. KO-2023]
MGYGICRRENNGGKGDMDFAGGDCMAMGHGTGDRFGGVAMSVGTGRDVGVVEKRGRFLAILGEPGVLSRMDVKL